MTRRTIGALVLIAAWTLQPTPVQAGQTRVYISFSFSGVVLVGGVVLFLSIGRTVRVSERERNEQTATAFTPPVMDSDLLSGYAPPAFTLSLENDAPAMPGAMAVNVTLFRW